MSVDRCGPACLPGTRSCFGEDSPTRHGGLAELARVIAQRAARPDEHSYTARLLAKGPDAALRKVGEEALEVIFAAKGESDRRLAEESADLLYHLLVALRQRGLGPEAALEVLRERRRPR